MFELAQRQSGKTGTGVLVYIGKTSITYMLKAVRICHTPPRTGWQDYEKS